MSFVLDDGTTAVTANASGSVVGLLPEDSTDADAI